MSILSTQTAIYLSTALKLIVGTTISLISASLVLCGCKNNAITGLFIATGISTEEEPTDEEKGNNTEVKRINPVLRLLCIAIVWSMKLYFILSTSYIIFFALFPEHF